MHAYAFKTLFLLLTRLGTGTTCVLNEKKVSKNTLIVTLDCGQGNIQSHYPGRAE